MKWIGLTGGIASGKSTVSRMLQERGVPVVCADELAREVVRAGTDGYGEVVELFGKQAIGPDGELNRRYIAEQVFGQTEKLKKLEAIIHPRVRELAEQKKKALEKSGAPLAFYDVPLLFEKNLEPLFDATVVVSCSETLQKKRLMERDNLSEAEAEKRIRAQIPLAEKAARADYVIPNEGSLAELSDEVEKMLAGTCYHAQE